MTSPLPPDSSPWHAGEKQLQDRICFGLMNQKQIKHSAQRIAPQPA